MKCLKMLIVKKRITKTEIKPPLPSWALSNYWSCQPVKMTCSPLSSSRWPWPFHRGQIVTSRALPLIWRWARPLAGRMAGSLRPGGDWRGIPGGPWRLAGVVTGIHWRQWPVPVSRRGDDVRRKRGNLRFVWFFCHFCPFDIYLI